MPNASAPHAPLPAAPRPARAVATSVLVPSGGRPEQLERCLRSLAEQDVPPDEVLVVWQDDDAATRDAADGLRGAVPYDLRILHAPERSIVAAENVALGAAAGTVVLLIDDDAVAPRDWVARHLAHYADPTVGAVGGPANNFRPDGTPFPRRTREPVGTLTWYGKIIGNMYDHDPSWRARAPRAVDHLVGYNLSFRRAAVGCFDDGLKPYWQMFEADACFAVKRRGYRVLFDFANAVDHHPTNVAYRGGRTGDLTVAVFNSAYNRARILSRHSPAALRPWRALYLLLVGSVEVPGLLGAAMAVRRFGDPRRELCVLAATWRAGVAGWRAGAVARDVVTS